MSNFRAMMLQAHHDGERNRAMRTAEAFRAISRCQVYHKTRDNLARINVEQLATWMGKAPNIGPRYGQRNYHSFTLEYECAFSKLFAHGFLMWGELINGGWNFHNAEHKMPEFVLFELTESGSQFLKECATDYDIIKGMGLWKSVIR